MTHPWNLALNRHRDFCAKLKNLKNEILQVDESKQFIAFLRR